MERTFEVSYYTFNIKEYSNLKGPDSYANLIHELYKNKIKIKTRGDSHLIIRSLSETTLNGEIILYGNLTKFTWIEGNHWFNFDTMEIENYEIPRNLFPNSKETEFVFVPSCHRFSVRRDPSINPNSVLKFLNDGLNYANPEGSKIIINIEQSSDIFDRIYSAKKVERLNVNISYTNDDFSEGYEEWMDKMLKDANIQEFSYKAVADESNNINVNNKLVKGTLELAQNNGSVDAKIVNESGRKETIHTSEYPRVDKAKVNTRKDRFSFAVSVASQLIERLRNGLQRG
ncbi:DUF4747 family protein [Cesiribacter sp. SM1]|uniref:DUF4747 family protein n=1 Tax=Cesiribacter sp. SM1 TaxID=2861196 RepID=UPI001CD20DB7|nr:DUF4747 family protein [Cesiribacter sp. SM1]